MMHKLFGTGKECLPVIKISTWVLVYVVTSGINSQNNRGRFAHFLIVHNVYFYPHVF